MPHLLAAVVSLLLLSSAAAAAELSPPKGLTMNIANAWLIPAGEARALVAPWFAKHHRGADLARTLDDDLMFGGTDTGDVLAVPAGTAIDGDLLLDWEAAQFDGKRIRGILALGRLTITGDIRNDNWDGGPFLIALGPLSVRHVLKRAAPLIAFASLNASGTIYCEYNHGMFRALGGVSARGIVMDDHSHELADPVDAPLAVLDEGAGHARAPHEVLMPELFDEEDEYGRIYPIDDLNVTLRRRILNGEAVFRPDAPRGR